MSAAPLHVHRQFHIISFLGLHERLKRVEHNLHIRPRRAIKNVDAHLTFLISSSSDSEKASSLIVVCRRSRAAVTVSIRAHSSFSLSSCTLFATNDSGDEHCKHQICSHISSRDIRVTLQVFVICGFNLGALIYWQFIEIHITQTFYTAVASNAVWFLMNCNGPFVHLAFNK